MKITILCVGKVGPSYLKEGIQEFLKRLQPYGTVTIQEVKEAKGKDKPSEKEQEKVLADEAQSLLRHVKDHQYVILLDVHGQCLSSEGLAEELAQLGLSGKSDLVFIIGGAFGVHESLRQRAQRRLSFSPMTFTHQMIRLLLVEQLYRAFKINRNEPYHW